jgi:hypothetical protein
LGATLESERKLKINYQNYLTNNSSSFQDKIKLKQVTKDWDAYKVHISVIPVLRHFW